jgi:hypothetical protein
MGSASFEVKAVRPIYLRVISLLVTKEVRGEEVINNRRTVDDGESHTLKLGVGVKRIFC